MKRVSLGILMSLALAIAGFFLGGTVAMRWMVSGSDGLAGGATVALFAFGAAIAGVIAGILMAIRIPASRLVLATALSLAAAVFGWGMLMILGNAGRPAAQGAGAALDQPVVDTARGASAVTAVSAGRQVDSVIALVTAAPDLVAKYESREIGYEEPGLMVFERGPQGYLVRTRDGKYEWLAEDAAGRYEPLETLIPNRLNYLTAAWDGQLLTRPALGAAATTVQGERQRETPAVVTGYSTVGGVLMFSVEIQAGSPCDGGDTRVVASGWVPAWAANGEAVAWYYARGC